MPGGLSPGRRSLRSEESLMAGPYPPADAANAFAARRRGNLASMTTQRTIVITGASSGIGRAVALGFAAEGASLLLIARDPDELDIAVEDCRLAGGDAEGFVADVGSHGAVQAAADWAAERFGGIDVWVNNAGVYMIGDVADTPVEDMRRLIETDLLGTIYGSHAAVRRFRQQGHGVLINNSSMLGG